MDAVETSSAVSGGLEVFRETHHGRDDDMTGSNLKGVKSNLTLRSSPADITLEIDF
jgi:hypothetical protein